jgi:hypothetical protein
VEVVRVREGVIVVTMLLLLLLLFEAGENAIQMLLKDEIAWKVIVVETVDIVEVAEIVKATKLVMWKNIVKFVLKMIVDLKTVRTVVIVQTWIVEMLQVLTSLLKQLTQAELLQEWMTNNKPSMIFQTFYSESKEKYLNFIRSRLRRRRNLSLTSTTIHIMCPVINKVSNSSYLERTICILQNDCDKQEIYLRSGCVTGASGGSGSDMNGFFCWLMRIRVCSAMITLFFSRTARCSGVGSGFVAKSFRCSATIKK